MNAIRTLPLVFLHAFVASMVVFTAHAQSFPTKPIRMIVAVAPGGTSDFLARIIAVKISEQLGVPVVVDNRPGASGVIAMDIVAKATPDGHTIGLQSLMHIVNPSLYAKMPYDTLKDLAAVSKIAVAPLIVTVNPSVRANSFAELIALAKASPGNLRYGSSGNGGAQHLGMELIKSQFGIDMTHVPYKGGGPAITALLAGEVQVFLGAPSIMPQVQAGKLRVIASAGARRSPMLADVPTIAEAGLPGFEIVEWWGIFAPAGLPAHILRKLNTEIVRVLSLPDVKERSDKIGLELVGDRPEQFDAFLRTEHSRWANVVKQARVKLD
jgi:tripartite-type tricarboxylate transporter receptor subunit TctC